MVADTTPRNQPLRVARVVLNRFPQTPNRYIHGAHITKVIITPDGLQEVLPVDNLTDVLGQVMEQFELPVGQINVLTTLGNRIGLGVNRQVPNLDVSVFVFFCWSFKRGLAPQIGLNPSHQFPV